MKTILALTDFSQKSVHAADYALRLAENLRTDLCLCTAFSAEDIGELPPNKVNTAENITNRQLEELANRLVKQSQENKFLLYYPKITYVSTPAEPSDLGDSIADIVRQRNIGMIIMGAKGDECLSNFIPGTQTYSVMMNTVCPILFIPEKAHFSRIGKMALITDNGSLNHESLLLVLKDFQEIFNTEILFAKLGHLMQEVGVGPTRREYNPELKKPVRDITEYELADQLQEVAGQGHIDVLGVMFHKEHLFERIFHSSTSKFLMFNANLPLLVFPANN